MPKALERMLTDAIEGGSSPLHQHLHRLLLRLWQPLLLLR
jgi:hypothetical protein